MGVVLVHHGQVVINIFLTGHHTFQTVVDDHRQLVGIRRVVTDTIRNSRSQNVAVPILMLQSLAIEGCPPSRSAKQESTRLHIAGRPGQIADPLEAEHRVVNIERHHHPIVRRIRSRRRYPGAERASLIDPFFQNLTLLILAVVHHLITIDRFILLTLRRIDPELTEHPLHSESPCLIRNDRHDPGTERLIANQCGQNPNERLCSRNFTSLGRRLQNSLQRR